MPHGPEPLLQAPPAAIGRYEIRARTWAAPTNSVYEAFDPLIGRPVWLEVFPTPAADGTTVWRTMFADVVQRTSALDHAGIAAVFDAWDGGEVPSGPAFIASEYSEGTSLARWIDRREPRSLVERVALMLELADALDYAHALNLAHLDLHPERVRVAPDNHVKVSGFGAAAISDAAAKSRGIGRPPSRYDAPERRFGRGAAAADVYSLAQLALDVLGDGPSSDSASADASTETAPVRRSPEVIETIRRACADDPDARFASARAFVDALGRALNLTDEDGRAARRVARVSWLVRDDPGMDVSSASTSSREAQTRVSAAPVPLDHTPVRDVLAEIDGNAETMIDREGFPPARQ